MKVTEFLKEIASFTHLSQRFTDAWFATACIACSTWAASPR